MKFEFCSKIGNETIETIAKFAGPELRRLFIVRNFIEKSARIDDKAVQVLSENCPNLEQLSLIYSRKFDSKVCQYLGSGNFYNLRVLDLSYCPI